MKKKLVTLFLLSLFLLSFALVSFATAHDGLCGCGREFAREDGNGFMVYDCLGCGRNYTSCTCKTCWCGSDLTRTQVDRVEVVTCDDCGLPCEECICRDRSYYEALKNVEQGLTGEEIPNPENGVLISLAVLLPFVGFLALYFTVYRRRSATRNRKDRLPRLEKELDAIDKEPDARKRYRLAKTHLEEKAEGDCRILDREGKLLCVRKNELLADAVEDEGIRDTVRDNLQTWDIMNRLGFAGSVKTVDRLWNFRDKKFSPDRAEISGESPAQTAVKWNTENGKIALFELITPLNGESGNLLKPASNLTRYTARIFEPVALMNRKVDKESEPEVLETLESLVPGANLEELMKLPTQIGETRKAPQGLPEEATAKRMGDKTRFPGGMM